MTEQLAKNVWLGGNDGNAWAKLKDMALALKLGQRYPKAVVLQYYLATAYFGEGAYGIDRAKFIPLIFQGQGSARPVRGRCSPSRCDWPMAGESPGWWESTSRRGLPSPGAS